MAGQSNEKSTTKKFLIITSQVWSLEEEKMISYHWIRLSPTRRLHLETTVQGKQFGTSSNIFIFV